MESNYHLKNRNQAIETYIERVTELTQIGHRVLSHDELLTIASELGISDSEIAIAQKQSQSHYVRAQGNHSLKHWDEAIEELENALAINPFNLPMLHLLIKCYLGRWRQSHNRQDIELINLRIKQCLEIQPDDQESLKLLAQLDKFIHRRKIKFLTISGFFVVLTGSLIGLFISSNISLEELVNRESKLQAINESLTGQIKILEEEQILLQQKLSGELYQQQQLNKELEFKIQQLENQIKNLNAKQQELIRKSNRPFITPPQVEEIPNNSQ